MRPILIGDILACARLLQRQPHALRLKLCAQWLYETHCADKYRKRKGRVHPKWGNGSLMARCTAKGPCALTPTSINCAEFRSCMALVLLAINRRNKALAHHNNVLPTASFQECDP